MSTHVPGFQSFSCYLHHFVLAKLATSNSRVKLVVQVNSSSDAPLASSEPDKIKR